MTRRRTSGVLAIVLVALGASLRAHHSLVNYDTETPMHLRGVVVRFEQVNPHSLIFLDHEDDEGRTSRWALEGPGPVQLARMGLDTIPLKVGDVITACGYATKQRVDRTAGPANMTGRAFNPEMLVLADGSTRAWSDYGQHHCLGKDYKDIHSRAPWSRSP